MTNIRTHPHEWERMLHLIDLDDLSKAEEVELQDLRELFSEGKGKWKPRKEGLLPVNEKIKRVVSESDLPPVNKKIRRLVLESGMSLSEIERLSGIGRVNLHNIICGETKNINLKNAFLLADFFEIDVNDFREERLK